MTIHNAQAFVDGQWDWAILNGCFGGNISPSDIDGQVERNGFFLYIEAKSPGVPIPKGQEILIQNRVRDGISFYMIVWGNKNEPEYIRLYMRDGIVEREADITKMREICKWWYEYANTHDWRKALR